MGISQQVMSLLPLAPLLPGAPPPDRRAALELRTAQLRAAPPSESASRSENLPTLSSVSTETGEGQTFLDDPRIPIHNNDAERDLRHLAIGRKNWLVFASPRGGEVACRLYSLVLSCKQSGVDPQAFFADVMMKVATVPAANIATLTPWAWQAGRAETRVAIERGSPGRSSTDLGRPDSTAQPPRERDHLLPHGCIGQDAINQVRGRFRHAPPHARRAEATALAGALMGQSE